MKRHTLTVLALVGLMLAVGPAFAMKSEFALESPDGKAAGIGQVEARRGLESFKLRVFADVPDGTTLLVLVERKAAPSVGDPLIPVAKIEMSLGSGILALDNKHHVSPVFPVKGLKRVVIKYKGQMLLEGLVYNTVPGN